MSRPGPRLTDRLELRVLPSCASCGAQRLTLNGARELQLGEPCAACGSLTVRVPRQAGQWIGGTVSPGEGGHRGSDECISPPSNTFDLTALGEGGQPPATGKRRPPSPSATTTRGGGAR